VGVERKTELAANRKRKTLRTGREWRGTGLENFSWSTQKEEGWQNWHKKKPFAGGFRRKIQDTAPGGKK